MTRRAPMLVAVLLAFIAITSTLNAAVVTAPIFGDHMVVQRQQPIAVWGSDAPGQQVTVTLGDAKAEATTGADGLWRVALPSMEAGGPYAMTVEGSSKLSFDDVLVGEVWLCGGQSNMEWPLKLAANPKEEIAAANYPKMRVVKPKQLPAATPQLAPPKKPWEPVSPEIAPMMTAVGYYFGREIHRELDVPVGLIAANWGGTRIDPWTPPVGFEQVPALAKIASKLDQFPKRNEKGEVDRQSPMALYNGMIHPLVPYGIRGAIWYQGEGNNGEGMLYFEKMKALIGGWRTVWNQPDMPFYYAQLAPYRYNPKRVAADGLPRLWEAQTAALDIPNTGMAVTVDIGTPRDIHPKNKVEVGRRLALWALSKTYGKQGIVYSGPLYKSMTVEGGKARLAFDHLGGGLVSRDGNPLTYFEIAGDDHKFVDAKAEIDGSTVVVSAEGLDNPIAVRYAWKQDAQPNLSNKEGLPASPFRTDRW